MLASMGACGPRKCLPVWNFHISESTSASSNMDHKTSSFGGMLKMITMKMVQQIATKLIAAPQRPRFHGQVSGVVNSPAPRRLFRQFKYIGSMYARYSVMVLTD